MQKLRGRGYHTSADIYIIQLLEIMTSLVDLIFIIYVSFIVLHMICFQVTPNQVTTEIMTASAVMSSPCVQVCSSALSLQAASLLHA